MYDTGILAMAKATGRVGEAPWRAMDDAVIFRFYLLRFRLSCSRGSAYAGGIGPFPETTS
jgi:hypothetical protein